jgi:hypothetical protein
VDSHAYSILLQDYQFPKALLVKCRQETAMLLVRNNNTHTEFTVEPDNAVNTA